MATEQSRIHGPPVMDGWPVQHNKPDRATMRPDCVPGGIDQICDMYSHRDEDGQTDEATEQ